ncbi:hypothetical protein KCP77_22975 [Salmonella enterica subsp. enterica]|nr:hypothetical protein KCP77_22975 [Salmonella enterica subsp. enterica]
MSISPDTNLTSLLRARDEMQAMIHDTQCHVLALYELVRSGKEGETVQKEWAMKLALRSSDLPATIMCTPAVAVNYKPCGKSFIVWFQHAA